MRRVAVPLRDSVLGSVAYLRRASDYQRQVSSRVGKCHLPRNLTL